MLTYTSWNFWTGTKLGEKLDLRKWNEGDFGEVRNRKHQLMACIQDLVRMKETRPLSAAERLIKEKSKLEVEKLLLMEEISLRKKSQALWLREGDSNTKFNTISRLFVDGAVTTDLVLMGDDLVKFYSHLFTDDEVRRPFLDSLVFSSIDETDRVMLDLTFTEEEVLGVVMGMASDKASSPDSFSMAFFQCCWDIVKHDIIAVLYHFHTHWSFEKSINATFIALIPKNPEALECKDFRPISLIKGVYKIIAKVLANILNKVLEKVVSVS